MKFSDLKGATIDTILVKYDGDEYTNEIIFHTDKGKFKMYHDQECCESVYVEEVHGDMNDLLSTPILVAEERINESSDTETWTFYELRTIEGSVTIRWYGTSNGYYSETVDFIELKEGK